MSALLQTYPQYRSGRAIPPMAVWMLLSMLLHVALLLWTPRPHLPDPYLPPSLTVTLRPQPDVTRPVESTPPPPAAVAQPPVPRPPRPQAKRAPKVPPPVLALDTRRPEAPPAPAPPKVAEVPAPQPDQPPAPVAPPASQPAPATDLLAYVEARRRARGEAPMDAPSPAADRANRSALQQPSLSAVEEQRRRNGYGSFEIRRRGYDYAEYMFRGWNANFRRDGLELIEVQKGNNASIDLAVVRSIIGIIRRTEKGDFTWVSRRLGRTLTLSARPRDNAGLEEFMMQEFYDDLHRYR